MTVFETLEFADLEELEAAARYASFAGDMRLEFIEIAHPYKVEMAATELLNLRALWKAKRLWRYAGASYVTEWPEGIKVTDVANAMATEGIKLTDYLIEYWGYQPGMDRTAVDEAICLLERCRGRQDASPWSDSDRAAIDEFVKTEPAPDWHPPTDSQPPSGGPADPVPSELYQGEIDEVEVHDHPLSPGEIAKKVHENQGRRVARGPRPAAERGSGEGRGSVGPPEGKGEGGKGEKKGHK